MQKRALITGITGQDGSYLAELLLSKGYEVHGTLRRSSSFNTGRIDHIFDRLHLHHADMLDYGSLVSVLCACSPHEVYNLAAQSHVGLSFEQPIYTWDVTARGCMNLLQAIREVELDCRFYQASTSELFGNQAAPQSETTPFDPRSPYAIAKEAAHRAVILHRQSYGLFACCGILFNHESPRRGETFVTRKITRAVARILAGKQDKLTLGNLDACRDWGYAPEYVEGMWRMLQQDEPDDYVLATGETHSVAEFVTQAFAMAGLDFREHVMFDPYQVRPAEVYCLRGDASKAKEKLGWYPQTTFLELVRMMVEADCTAIGVRLPGANSTGQTQTQHSGGETTSATSAIA